MNFNFVFKRCGMLIDNIKMLKEKKKCYHKVISLEEENTVLENCFISE